MDGPRISIVISRVEVWFFTFSPKMLTWPGAGSIYDRCTEMADKWRPNERLRPPMPAAVQCDWPLFKNETSTLSISTIYIRKFVETDRRCYVTNKQWMSVFITWIRFVLSRGGPRHIWLYVERGLIALDGRTPRDQTRGAPPDIFVSIKQHPT